MMVKEGAIVDATIIESSRRPRKVTEVMPEDRREEKSEMPASVVTYSDDPDANWIKKGKRAYYGYKGHTHLAALPISQNSEELSTNPAFQKGRLSLPTRGTRARRTEPFLQTKNS